MPLVLLMNVTAWKPFLASDRRIGERDKDYWSWERMVVRSLCCGSSKGGPTLHQIQCWSYHMGQENSWLQLQGMWQLLPLQLHQPVVWCVSISLRCEWDGGKWHSSVSVKDVQCNTWRLHRLYKEKIWFGSAIFGERRVWVCGWNLVPAAGDTGREV